MNGDDELLAAVMRRFVRNEGMDGERTRVNWVDLINGTLVLDGMVDVTDAEVAAVTRAWQAQGNR